MRRQLGAPGQASRRQLPDGRTQHPGRTTDRDTRKHTSFEHMYSIAALPTNRTAKQPRETAAITTNNRETETTVPVSPPQPAGAP